MNHKFVSVMVVISIPLLSSVFNPGLPPTTPYGIFSGDDDLHSNSHVSRKAPEENLTVCPDGPPLCDYSIIQDAVDAANNEDTILVAAGVYNQINNRGGLAQILYLVKSVTILGGYTTDFLDPPDPVANPTILDAQGNGRAVYIRHSSPFLEGLTFTGGDATGLGGTPYGDDAGGSIYILGGAPMLRTCIVTGNSTSWDGGGVYIIDSNAQLIRCEFSNNTARYGGGIYVWSSDVTLMSNQIRMNTSLESGGGVWLGVGSEAVLIGNVFDQNSGGTATFAGLIEGGGGMKAERCTLTLYGNIFQSNTTTGGGSGLSLIRCQATLTNNLFTNNHVDDIGGALSLNGANATLYHNTFARNSGKAIYLSTHWQPRTSSANLVNTIIADETVGIFAEEGNSVTLEATLWGSGDWANSQDWAGQGSINIGDINLWGDPDFLAPDQLDYHIGINSMAVDSGVDAHVYKDFEDDFRPFGDGFDIGADEIAAEIKLYMPLINQFGLINP